MHSFQTVQPDAMHNTVTSQLQLAATGCRIQVLCKCGSYAVYLQKREQEPPRRQRMYAHTYEKHLPQASQGYVGCPHTHMHDSASCGTGTADTNAARSNHTPAMSLRFSQVRLPCLCQISPQGADLPPGCRSPPRVQSMSLCSHGLGSEGWGMKTHKNANARELPVHAMPYTDIWMAQWQLHSSRPLLVVL